MLLQILCWPSIINDDSLGEKKTGRKGESQRKCKKRLFKNLCICKTYLIINIYILFFNKKYFIHSSWNKLSVCGLVEQKWIRDVFSNK